MSHFQRAVLRIGNFLILVTIGLVLLIGLAALFRHDPLLETLQFALILTVASIPVALPAVLSVTMAVGAEKLAQMKAIVSRLVSIEEMAGMDILCSDKTGTLTKNQLTLGEAQPARGATLDELMLAAALSSRRDAPDAIDAAILAAEPRTLKLNSYAVRAFRPFDPVAKRAEAEVEANGRRFTVAKGAPQVIVDLCKPDAAERKAIDALVEADAAKAIERSASPAPTRRGLGASSAFFRSSILCSGKTRAKPSAATMRPASGSGRPSAKPRDDSAETIAVTRAMGVDP